MPRSLPDAASAKTIARKNAAQQRTEKQSGRGPHPLPLFWQLVHAETGQDGQRAREIISAVARYQAAPVPPRRQNPRILAEDGAARLLSYGGDGMPVVLIPSLVNPSSILDLEDGCSLARALTAAGFDVYLVDWGSPGAAERDYDLAAYVQQLERLIGPLDRPVLAGYCLGGTLAMAAAVRGAGRALVTMAAPWDFAGYPDQQRTDLKNFWQRTRPVADPLGTVPMPLVQPVFWALDPGAPVRKFERYAQMPDHSPEARRFEAMEDWANSGPPVTLPAFTEILEDLFGDNRTGTGNWAIAGTTITPDAINIPWLNMISATDRIVPAAAAPPSPDDRYIAAGHVGMIVGGRARELLVGPMIQWLHSL